LFVKLQGVFEDLGLQDHHIYSVDWGDNTTIESGDVEFPKRTFLTLEHNYKAPFPKGWNVTVTVKDDDGGTAEFKFGLLPVNAKPVPTPRPLNAINEGDKASLIVDFVDQNKDDKHTALILWGDGSSTKVDDIPVGDRSFVVPPHLYKDDGPSPGNGKPQDT